MRPDLRFPEFEYEWVQKKIDNLTTKIGSGKTPKGGSANYLSEGIPFFRSQNIQNGYLNLNDLVYIDSEIDESMKNSKSYFGDILLNITGASIGRSAINTLSKTHINMNQHVCIIRLKKEFSFNFLGQFLLSPQGQKKIFKAQSGGSREGLNFKEIGSIKVNIPKNFDEQEKIGDFFSKLDRQIELEEQKLEKLEEQKKGYMQKIFSKELRFKDENGNNYPEWEDKKLLNVIAIQNGYAFKSNLFSEKGMPIIRITDINKSTVKKGTVYYPESIEINERFKIKQYDILIAMSGATTGKVGKYISEKPSLLNQRIGKFVMKKGTDNNFMFTYLNSLYFKKELSKLLVAGAQPNISSQDIENINLFIPINEEQRKIGEFFNELDGLIEKQSSKIGVLKQRKKGFLQKMFV